jgi:hypothetical protein
LHGTDHAALLGALRRAVLELPAHTDTATRTAAAGGDRLPEPLGSYLAKVRERRGGSATTTSLACGRPG